VTIWEGFWWYIHRIAVRIWHDISSCVNLHSWESNRAIKK